MGSKERFKKNTDIYIHTVATPEEEAALTQIMQELEAEPEDTTSQTSANTLVSVTNDDNIPAQREKLAILVSTGKSKEAIGVQLTHDQVKRLTDKDVQKYSKRCEAYIGNKTIEALIDSFIMLYSKSVGMVVSIDDVKALQEELNMDYIITQELSTLAGGLALRFGRFLALANTALITAKHITFETPPNTPTLTHPTHPTRNNDGYPLEGVDEVDSKLIEIEKESDRNL